jgi:2-oxoisovalerate dehydrogenase E1 component alpha subunit
MIKNTPKSNFKVSQKLSPKSKNGPQKSAPSKNSGATNYFGNLESGLVKSIFSNMVKARVFEDRLIKIYRSGESYFWIGGPGEEAWGVPLGLLAHKGQGPEYDFMHLHYRCSPTLIAMGMPMIDGIRLTMNRATDPSTGGRNFSNHFCFPKMNVAPVTSPLEVQYPIACGTAHVQKRFYEKNKSRMKMASISIVTGGDAGTAEGDFASSLILASRKGAELPLLISVQNNKWGISTKYDGQHGENFIADRAKAFNIRSRVIDGNDAVEVYRTLAEDVAYIRKTGKPAFVEAMVSRLNGHSSATGANPIANEVDPVKTFEKKIIDQGIMTSTAVQKLWSECEAEGVNATEIARGEPVPQADSIWDNVFVDNENSDWRKF